jgi:predicted HAD superfamily Cof-like phosphohydrolase
VPVLSDPAVPAPDRVDLRKALIREEFAEVIEAMETGALPEIAKELVDAVYVLAGTALEYGIPLHDVWDAVQASNMAKVDPGTGAVRKRADGKVIKPAGWVKPDIAALLGL